MTIAHINSLWSHIALVSAEALRMSDAETERFIENRVARLIGLLPFIASCDDPERTALAHLAVFTIAGRGEARRAFDHTPEDNIEPLARLRTISDFKGGDESILSRGLALLGLCMVSGYRRDATTDSMLTIYNPANSAPETVDSAEQSFMTVLEANPPNDADVVLSIENAVQAIWQN